ncbi:MAG TPA: hypothetical protein VMA09_10145 [Candidatus Binataceae bacterium]|nr:hypothetical protein [Candidatus Binataceae bacterium]
MKRAAMVIAAALFLLAPQFAHAQSFVEDRQHPDDYTDEDSQPLAIASYVLYPIGWAVEWGIARPLKWSATKGPLSFIYKPADADENGPPPPIAYIPDNSLTAESSSPIPAPVSGAPTARPRYGVVQAPVEQPIAPPSSQPALH